MKGWGDYTGPLPAKGDRIELTHMGDDPDPIPVGSTGTVLLANRYGITVEWDNGRGLSLVPGTDEWRVL